MDDSGSAEARPASWFEEHESFEDSYIFPDGTKDSLRLGRVCKGACLPCLSRSAFQHSQGRLVRQRRRGRLSPRFVARRWWKSPGKLARYVVRGRMRLQDLFRGAANRRVLERLRRQFGLFFGDYRHHLVVKETICAGGTQGEIRAATWRCDDGCEYDVVVKVLKDQHAALEGLSQGMLGRMAELGSDSFAFHGATLIYKVTLLRDGRIGLVMRRYSCDLRQLIERAHPFERLQALHLMREVAAGMDLLHSNGVLHGDLNPANVLVLESDPIRCYVADFECSGLQGVGYGTGFFRSPEVLRGVKTRVAAGVVIKKHSDIYSFAMTCYEICTGGVPFGDHRLRDYEFVLEGQRPELPDSIAPQVRDLIARCWHQEPSLRPTFGMIVQELDAMIRS